MSGRSAQHNGKGVEESIVLENVRQLEGRFDCRCTRAKRVSTPVKVLRNR